MSARIDFLSALTLLEMAGLGKDKATGIADKMANVTHRDMQEALAMVEDFVSLYRESEVSALEWLDYLEKRNV